MPTYVYRCRQCGHQFEHFEKMSSKRRSRKCPVCGGRGERQISGGAGFLFKGEGFYITDYRSEEYRSKHKAETEKAEPAPAAAASEKDAGASAGPSEKTGPTPVSKKRTAGAKKKKR
ncbi:MAG TPA: zinc ribbon domain-containing protein [Gemmatimonadota bacterium]|nr:zinc ribbon domain-containing protein [Gemmatimonadota bacterium]